MENEISSLAGTFRRSIKLKFDRVGVILRHECQYIVFEVAPQSGCVIVFL